MSEYETQRDYTDEVKWAARCAYDEYYSQEDGGDRWEAVFSVVDNHSFMTYNGYNLFVLDHSHNGPEEWNVYVEDGEESYLKVLNAMAYAAFKADVSQEFGRLLDAREKLGPATEMFDVVHSEGATYLFGDGYTFHCASMGREFKLLSSDGDLLEIYSVGAFKDKYDDYEKQFVNQVERKIAEYERD